MNIKKENISKAENKYDKAEEYLKSIVRMDFDNISLDGDEDNKPFRMKNSQRAIEHCAKSIVTIFGIEPPNKHKLSLDDNSVQEALKRSKKLKNERDPYDDNDYLKMCCRIIFMSKMYGETYPESEYGISEKIDLPPEKIIGEMEADQCFNQAVEILRMTGKILDRSRDIVNMCDIDRDHPIYSVHADDADNIK